MKKYRICTKCEIHHYENCETCFGFGVYRSNSYLYPIPARDAHEGNDIKNSEPCPECGSTVEGYPKLESEKV